MTRYIPAEYFGNQILELMEETVERVGGRYLDRNTSLFETLATISAEEASRPVSATCATLAAQVEHVRFYLDIMINAMQKKEEGSLDWGEIWRTVSAVTPDEWEASKARLKDSYQQLLDIMKAATWEDETEIGESMNALVHTAYHLGEIRQALCTIKIRES